MVFLNDHFVSGHKDERGSTWQFSFASEKILDYYLISECNLDDSWNHIKTTHNKQGIQENVKKLWIFLNGVRSRQWQMS